MENYRYDSAYETLYIWSNEHDAYIFAAKANGRTEKQTIDDYEEMLLYSECR